MMLLKCPAIKNMVCAQGCGCCVYCEKLKDDPFIECRCGLLKKAKDALAAQEGRDD